MTDRANALARVDAHDRQRAVSVRATYALAYDPERVFGIAPIRVVAEQRVQAIAYGDLIAAPAIVVLPDPLGRGVGELEPFADALHDYLSAVDEPRIWLPHGAALEIIDLLGHRYANNLNASATLQRMGKECRVVADEALYAGQQVVAVAAELFATHVATGQSPVEDRHLGAVLAWVTPPTGMAPAVEAARRALRPAAAMLSRAVDDRVEDLRRLAKRGGPRSAQARAEVERLLAEGARDEWALLVDARHAFWGLGLTEMARMGPMIVESRRRFGAAIQNLFSRPVRPDTLSRLLDAQEQAVEVEEDVLARSDASMLERLRLKGKALRAVLVARSQPSRGRSPCTLQFYTRQEVLRVRPGTSLQTVDGKIVGKVAAMHAVNGRRGTLIELAVREGFRSTGALRLLGRLDLLDTVVVDMSFRKGAVYRRLGQDRPALVYDDVLPAPMPRALPSTPLDAVAAGLRRP